MQGPTPGYAAAALKAGHGHVRERGHLVTPQELHFHAMADAAQPPAAAAHRTRARAVDAQGDVSRGGSGGGDDGHEREADLPGAGGESVHVRESSRLLARPARAHAEHSAPGRHNAFAGSPPPAAASTSPEAPTAAADMHMYASAPLHSTPAVSLSSTVATGVGLVGSTATPAPAPDAAITLAHPASLAARVNPVLRTPAPAAAARWRPLLASGLARDSACDISVMTGYEIDSLSAAELDALPALPLVVARCLPQTKVKFVEALQRRGAVVAMTGA